MCVMQGAFVQTLQRFEMVLEASATAMTPACTDQHEYIPNVDACGDMRMTLLQGPDTTTIACTNSSPDASE